MCIILFAHQAHANYPLILAANRDEFYARPTAHAGWWADAPAVLGGRDLLHGGTWLGVTREGRIAAVTNYRDPRSVKPDALSRGALVSDFLRGQEAPETYLAQLSSQADGYNGFNLLAGDACSLHYYSNRDRDPRAFAPDLHGISNHLLDTAWPKVEQGKRSLARLIKNNEQIEPEALFEILADAARAPDDALPETGVGLEVERMLSPVFITSPAYGTRSSTVVLVDADKRVTFVERRFTPGRTVWEQNEFQFRQGTNE